MVFEDWLIANAELKRVSGAYQLFLMIDTNSDFILLMEKVTDDLLVDEKRTDL